MNHFDTVSFVARHPPVPARTSLASPLRTTRLLRHRIWSSRAPPPPPPRLARSLSSLARLSTSS
eukprot:30200-Pelagococcus_subviridis.AAC.4